MKTLLAVAFKERTPRSDGVTPPPETAHVSTKERQKKARNITFEREESED